MADVAFLSRYARGGVPYDQKLIFEYSRKSAEAGNAFGMSGLAFCYMNSCGVMRDEEEAYRWAKISADLGHPCGLSRLGNCFQTGKGVEEDDKRAFELYRESAAAGSVNGRMAEAVCIFYGTGTACKRDEALDLYMDLVREHDWARAAESVVRAVRKHGMESSQRDDLALAYRTVEKCSEEGDPRAMWFLAHEEKDSLDPDVFLNRVITAARMGLPNALENLRCYMRPDIGEQYDFPVYAREEMEGMFARSAYLRGWKYTKCGNYSMIVRDCVSTFSRLRIDLELAEEICWEWLLKGHDHYHTDLSWVYCRGVEFKKAEFNRPELAVAHSILGCHKGDIGAWHLLRIHQGKRIGFPPDPVKALVVGRLALAEYDFESVTKDEVEELEAGLTKEQLQRVTELEAEGYPTALKFREWARRTIIDSGFPLKEAEAAAEERREEGWEHQSS